MRDDTIGDKIIYWILFVVASALASEWIGFVCGAGTGFLIGLVIGASF